MEQITAARTHGGVMVGAQRVAERERVKCLPQRFGTQSARVEGAIYNALGELCEEQLRVRWQFYRLSNGGVYLAPDCNGPINLTCQANGFYGAVSADAAGLVACALAYAKLGFLTGDDRIVDAFHQLTTFISQHTEAADIFAAIQ